MGQSLFKQILNGIIKCRSNPKTQNLKIKTNAARDNTFNKEQSEINQENWLRQKVKHINCMIKRERKSNFYRFWFLRIVQVEADDMKGD